MKKDNYLHLIKGNVLHLNLKKKWFNMIADEEKKEEYRGINLYWFKRLFDKKTDALKIFDTIVFKNGYSKNAPVIIAECNGIEVKKGRRDWGAEEGFAYYAIKIGEILYMNPSKEERQEWKIKKAIELAPKVHLPTVTCKVTHYKGFIILYQDAADLINKQLKIDKGDVKGFYNVDDILKRGGVMPW